MSYVDGNRPAPFGAITIYRLTNTLSDAVHGLWNAVAGHAVALSAFSPSQREDIGIGTEHLRSGRRAGLLASIVDAVREWDARRRTVAELDRLTEAQLEDIGLTRAHIEDLRAGRPLI